MKNKQLIIAALIISTLSIPFFPPILGAIALVLSIVLLCRKSDGIGLYLLILSIVCSCLGMFFGYYMLEKECWSCFLIVAVINVLISLCILKENGSEEA